jgi:hypothetical protein
MGSLLTSPLCAADYDGTTLAGIPPVNTVATADAASLAIRVRVACEADPMCGNTTVRGALSNRG